MATTRADPLPPGNYSSFILQGELPTWQAWVSEHHDSVRVLATIEARELAGDSPFFSVDLGGDVLWRTVGANIYFAVSAPTPWVGLGFPTIEDRPVSAWAKEHTEIPEYIPEPTPLDQIRNIALLGVGAYFGGILLQKVLRSR